MKGNIDGFNFFAEFDEETNFSSHIFLNGENKDKYIMSKNIWGNANQMAKWNVSSDKLRYEFTNKNFQTAVVVSNKSITNLFLNLDKNEDGSFSLKVESQRKSKDYIFFIGGIKEPILNESLKCESLKISE